MNEYVLGMYSGSASQIRSRRAQQQLSPQSAGNGISYVNGNRSAVPKLEVNPEQKQEIREAFELFDGNRDGRLNFHELKVGSQSGLMDKVLIYGQKL